MPIKTEISIETINNILPQTQCTRCGYPTCRDYASALKNDLADINQCPPGGNQGIKELAILLNRPIKPLNPANGIIKPRQLAIIKEDECIGCTLCIKACPVDAIIGSNKMMHTVIAADCTGCDLCIPACPVDCIDVYEDPNLLRDETRKAEAQQKFERHTKRIEIEKKEKELRLKQQAELLKNVRTTNNCDEKITPNETDFINQILMQAKDNNNK